MTENLNMKRSKSDLDIHYQIKNSFGIPISNAENPKIEIDVKGLKQLDLKDASEKDTSVTLK